MKGCWQCMTVESGKRCSQCGKPLDKLTKTEKEVLLFCRDYDPNFVEGEFNENLC